MKASDINLQQMLQFDPRAGRLTLSGLRMLIFNADAMGLLRKQLIEALGVERARGLLKRFGYASGYHDATLLKEHFAWDSDAEWLGSGPMMHMWEGITGAELKTLDFDRKAGTFYAEVIWNNSYEAEQHLKHFGRADYPVCWTLTGHPCGFGTAFLGKPVIARETECVGKGDKRCYVVAKTAEAWGAEAEQDLRDLEERSFDQEIRERDELIRQLQQQQQIIQELSTPVIQIWRGILTLPIVGAIDSPRAAKITEGLLQRIVATQARVVLLDITGVPLVDTGVANRLLKTVRAASLLGARCLLVGIRPEIAQTVVHLGVDLSGIETYADLQAGLARAFEMLGLEVKRDA